jgi:hypothetical protein
VLICAAIPASAHASTYTVDDDKADCPNAAFTSLQSAVNQAAPHDTLIVCPGTYLEGSTPTTNASSPAQAGSHNGLTIDKPLTIKGAGASKVLIAPNPAIAVAGSLAGTAPYLRDGGGNVITISRQSLGSTDADENRVDISGVTVASPAIVSEAGVAFFNTSGSIANSVIGPFAGGYGVIETNSLQGGGTGTVRREVTLAGSLVRGGVLFDDATGTDGAATNTVRSGIIQYGYVENSHIAGTVTYREGQRGHVTGSEADGIVLDDAEAGPDPANPSVRAFSATGNSLGGLSNNGASASAPGNWLTGAVTGAWETAPPAAAAPAALSVPAATADAAPAASFADPLDGSSAPVGAELDPVVVASDDFGVKSVALLVNGKPVATSATRPYVFSYTPAYADLGPLTLTAVVTDSSNQTTTTALHLTVPTPAGYRAATIAPAAWDAGTVLVGLAATQLVTIANSGQNPISLTSFGTTGAGFSVLPGSCSTALAVGAACTVTVRFAPTAEGPVTGALSVGYSAPGAVSPLTVALTGNGHVFSTSAATPVTGTVPATLALSLGAPASFGAFTPGFDKTYTASTTASVISTAGDAALSVSDPGHLTNGAFALPEALQVAMNPSSWTAPVSNAAVAIAFTQHIGAADALRTGSYAKTLTFTLSTTTP